MTPTDLQEKEHSFKDTLNLPHTDFPIRPNAKVDDPALLERWAQEKLYKKARELNSDQNKYILHDGPPYANGHIHLGHAYNKILKDILTKAHRMMGFHVPVTPGWDCHGLPIEHKVSQEHPNATPIELKKACRDYAARWVDVQREEFKKLGVIMDWDNPYLTMTPEYEAATIEALAKLVEKGFIERSNKTIAWCPFDKTVLASAEIEYKNRKDPSIYVLFELAPVARKRLFPTLAEPVYFVIWTTTPWTLPLNRAVLLRPHTEYVILEAQGKKIIVAQQLADKLSGLLTTEKKIVATINSQKMCENVWAQHPFIENFEVPVLCDDSVGLEDGTAVVHNAPGCGPIDYEIGIKNGLEIFSPISPDGKYINGIKPRELENMPVTDGQIWVIKKLAELGKLLFKTTINHSYPHCWRCHNPLIFRATRQWFFSLKHESIKQKTLAAINDINFIPEQGKSFLRATVENRWEWSLSRQRAWGVPIPALLCLHCDYAYTNAEFMNRVAQHTKKEGIEYWDCVTVQELLPKDLVCPHCKKSDFKKETDILDVWFDSGVSHYAVLYQQKNFPADIYLEGIDQHRGWFQSSLITSMAIEHEPPMKSIMTHGYTVDAQGRKMSKSLGNGVEPQEIINQLGTDGLRLWVASIGNVGDVVVSDTLLKNVGEVYRKIRNTERGLLMNLYDFNHTTDMIPVQDLRLFDQYALTQLYRLNHAIIGHYLTGNFTAIFHELADYCTTELSSLYFEVTKDRLYCEDAHGVARRSAQTTMWYMLDTLTRLMAPIMSFTAELVSDQYQKNKNSSIHLQQFAKLETIEELISPDDIKVGFDGSHLTYRTGHIAKTVDQLRDNRRLAEFDKLWDLARELRSAVLKAIEVEREKGIIKQSLEAHVILYIDQNSKYYGDLQDFFSLVKKSGQTLEAFLKELFVVSHITLATSPENLTESALSGIFVRAEHAAGTKCPRCWQWEVTNNPYGLDKRCEHVVARLPKK